MNEPLPTFLENGDLSSITTYQAGAMQSAANRALQKHCDIVLRNYGLSKMQWLIVGAVLDAGKQGVRITELAEKLGTTLPYLTTTINVLESKRMLCRKGSAHDCRSKLILVPTAFSRQCKEIEQELRESLRETVYSKIDPEEFRIYMKVLYELGQLSDN